MLDRASTFADPTIVKMLQTEFVPVAIDQAYQRRQQDAEGDFYRKIAGQGPRNDFRSTTQGFYLASPSGKLLLYNNNRHPAKVRRLLQARLAAFNRQKVHAAQSPIEYKHRDSQYAVEPPAGGLVIRVRAKVLGGFEPTTDPWRRILQSAVSRDNLWVTQTEHEKLLVGEFPSTLVRRIARFHLVDNTRGEPPMWKPEEIVAADILNQDGKLTGSVKLATADRRRGFEAQIKGRIEVDGKEVSRFDVVVLGDFWGEGRYTKSAPKGRFPLAIAFELADGDDIADAIPPQGSRGWVQGYLP